MPNNRSNSEVFDAYAKLAIEKGLIKRAEEKPAESKELKKYRNTTNPRVGSDTLEVITKLYNTKPDSPKSQQYKNNIMEVAHPNKVILTPSYDKLNSLIENNNERQRVMINITQKPVNGLLTQHKYAHSDLAQTLIAVATDLDNRDMDALRKLADDCISDLHKEAFGLSDIEKAVGGPVTDVKDVGEGALGGSTIGAVAGGLLAAFLAPEFGTASIWAGAKGGALLGGALGGVLSSIFDTAPQAKNVAINAKEASEQLEDLIKQFPNDALLTNLDKALTHIVGTATNYSNIVDQMHLKTNDPQIKKETTTICNNYKAEIQALDKTIDTFLSNAKSGKYAEEENDAWAKFKTPFTAIFGDTLKDAVQAIEQLERVNNTALDGIKATQREVGAAAEQVKSQEVTPQNWVETSPANQHESNFDFEGAQQQLQGILDQIKSP